MTRTQAPLLPRSPHKDAVELDRDGKPVRVFHRTSSGVKAWTHAPGAPCDVCDLKRAQRG